MPEQTMTISQEWLGMKPFVLIEADVDPEDGELILNVKAGGGAAEEVTALPLMMIVAAEDSPLHQAFRDAIADSEGDRIAIMNLAERVGLKL